MAVFSIPIGAVFTITDGTLNGLWNGGMMTDTVTWTESAGIITLSTDFSTTFVTATATNYGTTTIGYTAHGTVTTETDGTYTKSAIFNVTTSDVCRFDATRWLLLNEADDLNSEFA